jgi:hypothetical protein
MRPSDPDPVKLFVGVLHSDDDLLEKAVQMLTGEYGSVDYRSEAVPFAMTDYYQDEMGESIQRVFLSFQRLIDPGGLAQIKIRTNEIEDELAIDGQHKCYNGFTIKVL